MKKTKIFATVAQKKSATIHNGGASNSSYSFFEPAIRKVRKKA